jgi:multimeric flavodoxin WrbA
VQRDDLTPVLESIRGCDALVLASSTYFGEISSQAKGLVDRMFSFRRLEHRSRLAPGKKLALVLAQGNPSPSLYSNIGPRYAELMTSEFGFVDAGLVRCVGIQNMVDALEDPDVDDAIQAVAGRLLAASAAPPQGG